MQEEEGKTSEGDQRGTGGLGREEEGGLGKRALSKGTVKKKKGSVALVGGGGLHVPGVQAGDRWRGKCGGREPGARGAVSSTLLHPCLPSRISQGSYTAALPEDSGCPKTWGSQQYKDPRPTRPGAKTLSQRAK